MHAPPQHDVRPPVRDERARAAARPAAAVAPCASAAPRGGVDVSSVPVAKPKACSCSTPCGHGSAAPVRSTPTTPLVQAAPSATAVGRVSDAVGTSAGFAVGRRGDDAEREAERTASVIGGSSLAVGSHRPGELAPVRAASVSHPALAASTARPLDPQTRAEMEAAFGRDLGAVRTFSGASVDAEARRLGAAAFTIGLAVALPSSAPAMRSPAGRRLLAHELTHVLQQERAGSALVQRAECSLGHLDKECAGAAASCASGAAEYCATTYPTAAKLDEKWRKIDQLATDQSGELPNAAANLHHFLGATGVERVMPSEVFANHKKTIAALDVHREKLLAGARKRLENGTTAPGALSEEMAWTGTVQTFNMLKEDLGLAVGGFTLCSKARFTATKGSGDTYDVTLDPWTAQAFDCYNWDPGKGIGVGELNDMDMCCLENAGRGKHFRVRTEPWVVSATNTGSVTAVVTTGGAGGGGGGGDGGSGGGESKPSTPSGWDWLRRKVLGR